MTDAVYVMFTHAVVRRHRLPAASRSSVWYLLSSFAVINYTHHLFYVLFAAAGSFIGAYVPVSFLHPGPTYPSQPPGSSPTWPARGIPMSDWTLGDVKARNMEIVALCEQAGCHRLFTMNLDQLIEGVGAGYKLADIPPMTCPACGAGQLVIRLSSAGTPSEGDG